MKARERCWSYLSQEHTAVCFSASCQLGSSGLSFLQHCFHCPVCTVAWDYFVLLARSCSCLHWNPEGTASPLLQPVKVPQESIPVLLHSCAPHNSVSCISSQIMPSLPLSGLLNMLNLLAPVPTSASWILHRWTQPFEPGGPANFPLALTSIYSGQIDHFPYKDTTGDFDTGQSQSRPHPLLSPHSHSHSSCQVSQTSANQNGCSCALKRLSLKIQY